MIESLIMEHLIVVLSPMVTFGPMIELLIEQPGAILTGGTMIVFSKVCSLEILPPNFFMRIALEASKLSLCPQSNQFCTLNGLIFAPCLIMHSNASVRLY